jgi:Protein kinase domain
MMKLLDRYLDEKNYTFEEIMTVLLSVSAKIVEDSNNGIQNEGRVFVFIDEPNKIWIISSETKIFSSFNTGFDPEILYRNTVESLIETLKILEIGEGWGTQLRWRYSDTLQFYDTVTAQVIENYVTGKVPMDIDILNISPDGYLPINKFHKPPYFGEEYYNKVIHSNLAIDLPSWKFFIELDEKDYEQRKKKTKYELELSTMYLSHFLGYLNRYRTAFKERSMIEEYIFRGCSPPLIHPLAFLIAKRYSNYPQSRSNWDVNSIIGLGENSTVFSATKDNCECAIKLVKPGLQKTAYNVTKELRIWTQAEILGVGPKLIEYYRHNSDRPEGVYFIIVMEKLDITLEEALGLADKENHNSLRILLFSIAGKIITTLHKHYIAHGDAHFKNFMLKCRNKVVFQSAELLYQSLLSGECEMKIIDFGFSTTISHLIHHFEEELGALFPLGERLFQYGCADSDELFRQGDLEISNLFSTLCAYDFSLMKCYVKKNHNGKKILEIIEYLSAN